MPLEYGFTRPGLDPEDQRRKMDERARALGLPITDQIPGPGQIDRGERQGVREGLFADDPEREYRGSAFESQYYRDFPESPAAQTVQPFNPSQSFQRPTGAMEQPAPENRVVDDSQTPAAPVSPAVPVEEGPGGSVSVFPSGVSPFGPVQRLSLADRLAASEGNLDAVADSYLPEDEYQAGLREDQLQRQVESAKSSQPRLQYGQSIASSIFARPDLAEQAEASHRARLEAGNVALGQLDRQAADEAFQQQRSDLIEGSNQLVAGAGGENYFVNPLRQTVQPAQTPEGEPLRTVPDPQHDQRNSLERSVDLAVRLGMDPQEALQMFSRAKGLPPDRAIIEIAQLIEDSDTIMPEGYEDSAEGKIQLATDIYSNTIGAVAEPEGGEVDPYEAAAQVVRGQ